MLTKWYWRFWKGFFYFTTEVSGELLGYHDVCLDCVKRMEFIEWLRNC